MPVELKEPTLEDIANQLKKMDKKLDLVSIKLAEIEQRIEDLE